MSWAVRRYIGDSAVTFEIVREKNAGLALAKHYTEQHREAFDEPLETTRVTVVMDPWRKVFGYKTRRSQKHPFISYVVEHCDVVYV